MKKIPLFLLVLHLIFSSLLPLQALAAGQDESPASPPTYAASQLRGLTAFQFYDAKPGDVITVSTAEELRILSDYVNSGGPTEGVTFRQTADITLNPGRFNIDGFWYERDGITYKEGTPVSFTPVGNMRHAFYGTYDGNGYRIFGMYVKSEEDNAGFFGRIGKGAKLLNISLAYGFTGGKNFVGGIAGYADCGAEPALISHCLNENYVNATGNFAGGIVGRASCALIVSCQNKNWIKGDSIVGGIAGSTSDAKLLGCLNTAVVRAHTSAAGGIVGSAVSNSRINNCLGLGRAVAPECKGAVAGAADADTVKGCYYATDVGDLGIGSSAADDPEATAYKTALELKSAALVREMNRYHAESAEALSLCHPWTLGTEHPDLTAAPAIALVTAEGVTFAAGSLADAATLASAGATIKLVAGRTDAGGEMAGSFTLDLNGHSVQLSAPLVFAGGTVVLTDTAAGAAGELLAPASDAIVLRGAALQLIRGVIASNAGYGIRNEGTGTLQIPHDPAVKGSENDVFVKYVGTLSGSGPRPLSDAQLVTTAVGVSLGFELSDGTILAKNATVDAFFFPSLPKKFEVAEADGNLVAHRIPTSPLLIVGITVLSAVIAAAAILIIVKKTRKSAK